MGHGNRECKKSFCSDSIICVYVRMQVGTKVSETVMEERHGYALVVLV